MLEVQIVGPHTSVRGDPTPIRTYINCDQINAFCARLIPKSTLENYTLISKKCDSEKS